MRKSSDRSTSNRETRAPAATSSSGVSRASEGDTPRENLLLSTLATAERDVVGGQLELVDLKSLEVLVEAGKAADYVYFPVTAVISIVRGVSDGTYIETGTIGREGFAGISVFLGTKVSPHRLEVQVPGTCLRISASAFAETIGSLASFRAAAGKFITSLFDQTGQSVICSARHGIPQRCARWLLMAHDRSGKDTFVLTHTTLARMLDVRRAGVTVAALVLRKAGLIDYTRGQLTILDRAGLEAAACECYAINRAHLHELYTDLATS